MIRFEYHDMNEKSNVTGYSYLRWHKNKHIHTVGLRYGLTRNEFKKVKLYIRLRNIDKILCYLAFYTIVKEEGDAKGVIEGTLEDGQLTNLEFIDYVES